MTHQVEINRLQAVAVSAETTHTEHISLTIVYLITTLHSPLAHVHSTHLKHNFDSAHDIKVSQCVGLNIPLNTHNMAFRRRVFPAI